MHSDATHGAGSAELIPGYRIVSLIGRGGMGAVYKAVKESIGKEVAIKLLLPSFAEDPVTGARFDRELRALARIRHPGLVNVLDAGKHASYRYMVMDLVPGVDLEAKVKEEGPLDPGLVLAIARQLLDALDYVHGLGMVHRDLKPANIILSPDGKVRLCDLGLVRIIDEDSQLTQQLMLGTPEYVSPEQVRGESELDSRSDLYSLGATLYFLLKGHPPYQGKTPMATAQMHWNEKCKPQKLELGRSLRRLESLVSRLLQKKPSRRFKDPAEARSFLDDYGRSVDRPRKLAVFISAILILAASFLLPFYGRKIFGADGKTGEEDKRPKESKADRLLKAENEATRKLWNETKELFDAMPDALRARHGSSLSRIDRRLDKLDQDFRRSKNRQDKAERSKRGSPRRSR